MPRPWPDAILHPDVRAVDALSMHTALLPAARGHRAAVGQLDIGRRPRPSLRLVALAELMPSRQCATSGRPPAVLAFLVIQIAALCAISAPRWRVRRTLALVLSGNGPRTSNASGQPTFAVHSNFCIYPRLKHPHSLAFESGPSLSAPSAQEASRGAPVRLARPG